MTNITNPLLRLEGIGKRFSGVRALEDVSFSVAAGSVHAVVGENGAGKSTLMKIMAGIHPPDEGRLLWEGQPVAISDPLAARRLGIEIVFQEIELAPNLTVAQSVFLGREPRSRMGLIDHAAVSRATAAMAERLDAPLSPEARVESLSVAEKQLVQIARALQAEARLVIFDEPTSSLSDHEVNRLFGIIEGLRARGTTVLYVSHKLEEVQRLADTVTVLRDGRHIYTAPKAEMPTERIIELMAGAAGEEQRSHGRSVADEPLLRVERLTRRPAFEEVSFIVAPGQIVGLFGIVGAGRTELARVLFGLDRAESGRVELAGTTASWRDTAGAIAAGIGYVPEDRKTQGLILQSSLRRNASLAALPALAHAGILRVSGEHALAHRAIRDLRIATTGIEKVVRELSGGNQQKVVLARWLATRPRLLILDEPTKGIDIAAKREVHGLVRHLAEEGVAVLLITSELGEALALSDRLLVMRAGRLTAEFDPVACTREEVLRAAVLE